MSQTLPDNGARNTEFPDHIVIDTTELYVESKRVVGTGAMGRVFEAEQLRPVPRTVAVKASKGPGVSAFYLEGEANKVAALPAHQGIATVFHSGKMTDGSWKGFRYFLMEYIDGETLKKYCDDGKSDVETRVRLLVQVLDAVAHIHRDGLVHCDIKASNVLVKADGSAKLIDFGIARVAGEPMGSNYGTPPYRAPESKSKDGAPVVVRRERDIFAVGVELYRLLVGEFPFANGGQFSSPYRVKRPSRALQLLDRAELERRAAERSMKVDDYLAEVRAYDQIVMRALAKNPRSRVDAREFQNELKRIADELAPIEKPAKWPSILRMVLVGVVFAAAALFWGRSADGWLQHDVEPKLVFGVFAAMLTALLAVGFWNRPAQRVQRLLVGLGSALAAMMTLASFERLPESGEQRPCEGVRVAALHGNPDGGGESFFPSQHKLDAPRGTAYDALDKRLFFASDDTVFVVENARRQEGNKRPAERIFTARAVGSSPESVTSLAFHRFPAGREVLFVGVRSGHLYTVDLVHGEWRPACLIAPTDWARDGFKAYLSTHTTKDQMRFVRKVVRGVLRPGYVRFDRDLADYPVQSVDALFAHSVHPSVLALYIADAKGHLIHRLVISAPPRPGARSDNEMLGVSIQTVLGDGEEGLWSDDVASEKLDVRYARLSGPTGVVVRKFGNRHELVVADLGNNRLRCSTLTEESVAFARSGVPVCRGSLHTLLGGGPSMRGLTDGDRSFARIDGPLSLALFGQALVFTEKNNHTVRVLLGRRVMTLVGVGKAGRTIQKRNLAASVDGTFSTSYATRLRFPCDPVAMSPRELVIIDSGNGMLLRVSAAMPH